LAFKIAGAMALKDGAKKAKPILLEPVMKMQIVAPGRDKNIPEMIYVFLVVQVQQFLMSLE
jgi:translation elongation factor EF-G